MFPPYKPTLISYFHSPDCSTYPIHMHLKQSSASFWESPENTTPYKIILINFIEALGVYNKNQL